MSKAVERPSAGMRMNGTTMQKTSENPLSVGLERYLSATQRQKLSAARIGIAGLGGIGSNVCVLLARTGVEHFFCVDFDTVEASNLNRQYYFPEDIGSKKTEALTRILKRINPDCHIATRTEAVTTDNVTDILSYADIWASNVSHSPRQSTLCLS